MEGLEQYNPIPEGEMPLDPGIRRYVLLLRGAGVETYESCQGGAGHPCPEPMVRFHGGHHEGFRVFAIAAMCGLPVHELRRSWSVIDGELTGPAWEMTFRKADEKGGAS